MIGQENITSVVKQQIENDTFPRFSIFVGPKGSGRKTLVHVIAACMNGLFTNCDTSVDTVRNVIAEAYRLSGVTAIYFFPDADSMSLQAKNALLKITEEPPKNAYFIMTLEDENNTLDTIRSRGAIYYMDRYTPSEIVEYANTKYGEDFTELYRDVCETPGEVDIMHDFGVESFYDFVLRVVDNINRVSLANALKISMRISMKAEDTENYDLKMFWKIFTRICGKKM